MTLATAFAPKPKQNDKKNDDKKKFKHIWHHREVNEEVCLLHNTPLHGNYGENSDPIPFVILLSKFLSDDLNKQNAMRHTLISPNAGWII